MKPCHAGDSDAVGLQLANIEDDGNGRRDDDKRLELHPAAVSALLLRPSACFPLLSTLSRDVRCHDAHFQVVTVVLQSQLRSTAAVRRSRLGPRRLEGALGCDRGRSTVAGRR